jgi:hypothetical protein
MAVAFPVERHHVLAPGSDRHLEVLEPAVPVADARMVVMALYVQVGACDRCSAPVYTGNLRRWRYAELAPRFATCHCAALED